MIKVLLLLLVCMSGLAANVEPDFDVLDISNANGPIDTVIQSSITRLENSCTIVDSVSGQPVKITLDAGVGKMETTASFSGTIVDRGRDSKPDTYFIITGAGAIGDTIRFQLAATANDPTTPDDDIAAVDETYTLVAGDVGNEKTTRDNMITFLNGQAGFNASLKASKVKDRSTIWVQSKFFSLAGEFYERSTPGDVIVTPSGTTTIFLGFNDFISRAKEAAAQPDPDNPHLQSAFGITGSVKVSAEEIDELFEEFATNGAVIDLTAVSGNPVNQVFVINANPTGGKVKVIEAVSMYGTDTNIKVGESNFLGLNMALTNGILIEITKGSTSIFRIIKSTNDVLARVASSPEKSKIINQSGGDFIQATFDLTDRNIQLTLEPGTTDQIKVTNRDDLTGISNLFFKVEGFLEEE